MKWTKIIGWRVNNDGISAEGNGYIQGSFFRTQDDATYVRGVAIQRTVYWADVNGIARRTSPITADRGPDYPAAMPQQLLVEDIDVIFARGVFGGLGRDSFGIIGSPAGFTNRTLADDSPYRTGGETENTGQHVVFRNMTFSDSNPHRYLLGLSGLDSRGPGAEDDQIWTPNVLEVAPTRRPWPTCRFAQFHDSESWVSRNCGEFEIQKFASCIVGRSRGRPVTADRDVGILYTLDRRRDHGRRFATSRAFPPCVPPGHRDLGHRSSTSGEK